MQGSSVQEFMGELIRQFVKEECIEESIQNTDPRCPIVKQEPTDESFQNMERHRTFVEKDSVESGKNDSTNHSLLNYKTGDVLIGKNEPVEFKHMDTLSSTQQHTNSLENGISVNPSTSSLYSVYAVSNENLFSGNSLAIVPEKQSPNTKQCIYMVKPILTEHQNNVTTTSTLEKLTQYHSKYICSTNIKEKPKETFTDTELSLTLESHALNIQTPSSETVQNSENATSPLEELTHNHCMDVYSTNIKEELKEIVTDTKLSMAPKLETVHNNQTAFSQWEELRHNHCMDVCSTNIKLDPKETFTDIEPSLTLESQAWNVCSTNIKEETKETFADAELSLTLEAQALDVCSTYIKKEPKEIVADTKLPLTLESHVLNIQTEHNYQTASPPWEELTHNHCIDVCSVNIKEEPKETFTDIEPSLTLESQPLDVCSTNIKEEPKETFTDIELSLKLDSHALNIQTPSSQTLPNHTNNNQTTQNRLSTMVTRSVGRNILKILNLKEEKTWNKLLSNDFTMECEDELSSGEETGQLHEPQEELSVKEPSSVPVPIGILRNYHYRDAEKITESWVLPIAQVFPKDEERNLCLSHTDKEPVKYTTIETDQYVRKIRRIEKKDKRMRDKLLAMHMNDVKHNILKRKTLMEINLIQEIKSELFDGFDRKKTKAQSFSSLHLSPPSIQTSQKSKSDGVDKT